MKHVFLFVLFLSLAGISYGAISPITGPAVTVCTGFTLTFSDATLGGNWGSTHTGLATVDGSGVVTGIAQGLDSIYYTNGVDSAFITITVNPMPGPILGPSTLCGFAYFDTATFTAPPVSGYWASSNISIANIGLTSGVCTPIGAGVDTLTFTTFGGCATTKAITVNTRPDSIQGPSSICGIGNTITLTESTIGGRWISLSPSLASVDSFSGLVTALNVGYAFIAYRGPNGCYAEPNQWIAIGSSSIGIFSAGTLSIHRTPCDINDSLYVTGCSIGCNVTYTWQYSTDLVSWTNFSAIIPGFKYVNPVVTTYYRIIATNSITGLIDTSAILEVAISTYRLQSNLVNIDSFCSGMNLKVTSCNSSPSLSVLINYGDAAISTTPLTIWWGINTANVTHPYTSPGTYQIKEILFDGALPVDSISFPYEYFYCSTIPIKVFCDLNGDGMKNIAENFSAVPIKLAIDSNGIRIDTFSLISGLYYKTNGNPGDTYTFTPLFLPSNLIATTPPISVLLTNGTYYDTINYIGVKCTGTTTNFDLKGTYSSICGRHMTDGNIYVSNSSCDPQNAVVTLTFSPKYNFTSATPTPDVISGNVLQWNLSSLSVSNPGPRHISYHLDHPGPWLIVGDTAQFYCVINPTVGDTDTSNNVIIVIDTIKISYDPNNILVNPQGYVLAGAPLQYTINFENTGNDTAYNIYVMDTLSDNVDPNTLELLGASAPMNIAYLEAGGHHIVKFDFPNINLLDSSHHGLCDGMVAYKIKTYPSLADSTAIYNHAGIFFDDNPVVMTDTAWSGTNIIHGPDTVCIGATITLANGAVGGYWAASNTNASVSGGIVSGVATGMDTVNYTVVYGKDTLMVSKSIFVKGYPDAGTILGAGFVCLSTTTTYINIVAGGAWSIKNTTLASMDSTSGILIPVMAGLDTVMYSTINSCGATTVYFADTILGSITTAGDITGVDSFCAGTTTLFTSDALLPIRATGTWGVTNPGITLGTSGSAFATSAGTDSVYFIVANGCYGDTAFKPVNVLSLPNAGVLNGPDSFCIGNHVYFEVSMPGGILTLTNGNATSPTGLITSPITGASVGLDTIQYKVTNYCGSDSTFYPIKINPYPTAGVLVCADTNLCVGATVTLTDTVSGGNWISMGAAYASVDTNGVVTGLAAGDASIHYTVSGPCGVVMAPKNIHVIALPHAAPIGGYDTLCVGSSTILLDSVSGGTWMSWDASVATIAGNNLNVHTIGTDTITYRVANYCGADTAFAVIATLNVPIPTITGPTLLCIGSPDTLVGSPMGGTWLSGDTALLTVDNGILTGKAEGSAGINYKVVNRCGTANVAQSMNILKVPVVSISGDSIVFKSYPINLVGSPSGGTWTATNNWATVSNGLVSFNDSVFVFIGGHDTIIYSLTNACGTGSDSFLVILIYEGIPNLSLKSNISIYPNPTIGAFSIDLPNTANQATITISDMYGKEVKTLETNHATKTISVAITDFARGTYLVKVVAGNDIYRAKLVVW